jgi:hypothetical protein
MSRDINLCGYKSCDLKYRFLPPLARNLHLGPIDFKVATRQGGRMAVTTQRDLAKLALAPSATEREKAARTHTAIRQHLESDPLLRNYKIDTFLQGSYKNSTNVRGDSDVDMGSLTNEVFHHDTSGLPTESQYQYGHQIKSLKESVDESLSQLGAGNFNFWEYRADVLASLQRKYGVSVVDGNKAIKIAGNTYRLDADVLPCMAFRQYYKGLPGASYHNGIVFFSKTQERIVNFPHQHFTNLSQKDQDNDGRVKGCIRIMKRLRNELEEKGEWDRKRSPSYYIESLVWNCPNIHFKGPYDQVFPGVVRFLWNDLTEKKKNGDISSYIQANNIFLLFHSTFWNVDDAIAFLENIWKAVY